MQTEAALWFDGRRAERRPVTLAWLDGQLVLHGGDGPPRRYPLAGLQWGPCWRDGPWALTLPDGGSLWLNCPRDTPGPVARQLMAAGALPGRVERTMRSTAAVLWVALCVIALLVWLDRQGVGMAAERLVAAMPRTVDVALGQRVFASLDQRMLAPSQAVSEARQQALHQRWQVAAAKMAPDLPCRLYFRTLKGSPNSLNAFALPDGSVVVFDALARALDDDELLAVLGHELGHVVHRHGLKGLARGVGLAVLGQLVLGDFSSWTASLASGLETLSYSRDVEREADAFIPSFLAAAGLPAGVEARMWRRFHDALTRQGSGRDTAGWLSTHPGFEERIRAADARSIDAAGL